MKKLSESKRNSLQKQLEKKMEKFTNAVIARELKEFRSDIVESRKRKNHLVLNYLKHLLKNMLLNSLMKIKLLNQC